MRGWSLLPPWIPGMGKTRGIRAKGSGSVYQIASGMWRVAVVVGRDPRTGRLKRRYRSAKTEREAVRLLNEMLPLVGNGFTATPRDLTVKAWLSKYAQMRAPELRPRTRENHQYYIRRVGRALGDMQLARLSPIHVRELYASLVDEGLSPSVRQHIHHFLDSAFRDGVQLGILPKSPMAAVDRPKSGRVVDAAVWDAHQAKRFLEVASSHRLYAAFYLMLACGMRIGEVLALQWGNVTDDMLEVKRTMSVVNNRPCFGPPKTERGRRAVYFGEDVRLVLEARRTEQELERQIAGARWFRTTLVFTSVVGTPLNPNNVRRAFRAVVTKAGLPKIRIHDLRHTYITLARDAGLDAEVIANRVGQDVRVTMQTYSQVTESRKRKAAIALDALLEEDRNG